MTLMVTLAMITTMATIVPMTQITTTMAIIAHMIVIIKSIPHNVLHTTMTQSLFTIKSLVTKLIIMNLNIMKGHC